MIDRPGPLLTRRRTPQVAFDASLGESVNSISFFLCRLAISEIICPAFSFWEKDGVLSLALPTKSFEIALPA
jgi:hypothetical protein